MRSFKKALLIVIIFAIMFITIFGGKIFGSGHTAKVTDNNGDVIPGSIASLEEINLGGMKQSILIRGHDESNPKTRGRFDVCSKES